MKQWLLLFLVTTVLFSSEQPAIKSSTLTGRILFSMKNVQLILQSSNGNESLVKTLLSLPGIQVNFRDTKGKTALYHAAQVGNSNIVTQLLNAGADKTLTDSSNKTAAQYAQESNHQEIISLLS